MMGRILDSILRVDSNWLNISLKTILRTEGIRRQGEPGYRIYREILSPHKKSEISFRSASTGNNHSRYVDNFLEIMISNDPKLYWTRIIALLIKNGNVDEVKELLVELEI
jgi:hypothetical protein